MTPTASASAAVTAFGASAASCTQAVADSAEGLLGSFRWLQAMQSAGKLSSVSLTGTSNNVTAAEARRLAGLARFALDPHATLQVTDGALNLLLSANEAGLACATEVVLTGSNTSSAAQATMLAKLPGFRQAPGASLMVADDAPGLLAPEHSSGMALASMVALRGANAVTADEAAWLAGLNRFVISIGATLSVADSAAALLAEEHRPGIARATAISLRGAGNVVTAAQAARLVASRNFSMAPDATLEVVDSAVNLVAVANAHGVARATRTAVEGHNRISAAQARALAGLRKLERERDATVVVADHAANLLAAANAAGTALATQALLLGGNNTVNAAQAARLVTLTDFTRDQDATLVVKDTAASLLANLQGASAATTVCLIGSANVVTAAQCAILARLPNFVAAAGACLVVQDDAASLLRHLPGVLHATAVSMIGNQNTVNALQAVRLANLNNFRRAPDATLAVLDSAANLLAVRATVLALATSIQLAGVNRVNMAQARSLLCLGNFSIDPRGALVVVSMEEGDAIAR